MIEAILGQNKYRCAACYCAAVLGCGYSCVCACAHAASVICLVPFSVSVAVNASVLRFCPPQNLMLCQLWYAQHNTAQCNIVRTCSIDRPLSYR